MQSPLIQQSGGALYQPFQDRLYTNPANFAGGMNSSSNARLIGSGTNLYMGFKQIYIPHPIEIAGYCNNWAGNDPSDTSIGLRIALYNSYSVNGLPSTVVAGSDTGSFTYLSFKQAAVVTDIEFRKTLAAAVRIAVPGWYWIAMVHVTSATISGNHFRGLDVRGGVFGLPNLVLGAAGDTGSLNANIATYTLPESATPAGASFTKSPAVDNFCNINHGFLCNRI